MVTEVVKTEIRDPARPSVLFGVGPRDGAVFVAVPVVLALIGLGTVAIVARRAGRVDPLEALRHD